MCGIAGLVNLNGRAVSPEILKNMTDAIIHRGPDGEGYWFEGNVGLGHRRLAIIDLSASANQPMISISGRYILSYNGEIYNYKELRTELEAAGYEFRNKSDSEVVLNALSHWGTPALLMFNGMFALALWDRKEKTLLLARDRYGIKPLYYAQQGNSFSFGSEQKAIAANPDFNRKIDNQGLLEYFTFQNILTDKTLLKDVNILKPGHYAILDTRSSRFNTHEYWDYNFCEPEYTARKEEYVEELNRLFCQAVNRQLVSDVEVGSYLSGGIDSGSITAIASKTISNLKTFTCGFDLSSASGLELAFDERTKAEAMSASFKTEHYEMILKAGDMERCMPKLAWHLEEPRVGQSYPNYYAAKLSSKFVKVVLSGSGGDELFGGYPWRYYHAYKSQKFEEYIDSYYLYWQRLLNEGDLKTIMAPIWGSVGEISTRDIFRDVFAKRDTGLKRPEDYINDSLYFEAKTFLHGLFVVEDKLSMAHGLEVRVPFMDNDLVDFSMQCPVSLKLKNIANFVSNNQDKANAKIRTHFKKTNDGKQILRDAMSRHLSLETVNAIKQGFSAPDASWFKGESLDYVRKTLMTENAPINSILDAKKMTQLVNQHLSGEQNHRLLIWSLLNVNAWLELNL